ncbi:MAG: VOC family protein [Dehalococcoidia bacterium]|nr:VOC family protein [Dehalococcoidia bacterium]
MEVKELGHVVLFVRDLERSAHFYRDILGFRQVAGMGNRGVLFSSGRTHHELLLLNVGQEAAPVSKGHRAGLYHIGLKIGETDAELQDALDQLEKEGVTVVGMSDHTVTHSLYILDPDGNEVELYIDVQPAVWKDNPAAVASPTKPLYALSKQL